MTVQRKSNEGSVTQVAAERYGVLSPLLNGLYGDIKDLTAKKQDGVLSIQRIGMINKLLDDIRELLKDEPTHPYLELLQEESVPKNSDALLIIGGYRSALKHYLEKYTNWDSGQRVFRTH